MVTLPYTAEIKIIVILYIYRGNVAILISMASLNFLDINMQYYNGMRMHTSASHKNDAY